MYTLIKWPKPKRKVGVRLYKQATLQYGNQTLATVQYNNHVVSDWEKCYALHRKHNHSVTIIIFWE